MITKTFKVFLLITSLLICYANNCYGMDNKNQETVEDIADENNEDKTKNFMEFKKSSVKISFYISNSGLLKFMGSFSYSVLNSLLCFEKITMNAWYKNLYILCFGYRWQPNIMKSYDWFFDLNINIVGGLSDSIFAFFMLFTKYNQESNIEEGGIEETYKRTYYTKKVKAVTLLLGVVNLFNANINIKIKGTYIAINFLALIKIVLYHLLLKNILNFKLQEKVEEINEEQ